MPETIVIIIIIYRATEARKKGKIIRNYIVLLIYRNFRRNIARNFSVH